MKDSPEMQTPAKGLTDATLISDFDLLAYVHTGHLLVETALPKLCNTPMSTEERKAELKPLLLSLQNTIRALSDAYIETQKTFPDLHLVPSVTTLLPVNNADDSAIFPMQAKEYYHFFETFLHHAPGILDNKDIEETIQKSQLLFEQVKKKEKIYFTKYTELIESYRGGELLNLWNSTFRKTLLALQKPQDPKLRQRFLSSAPIFSTYHPEDKELQAACMAQGVGKKSTIANWISLLSDLTKEEIALWDEHSVAIVFSEIVTLLKQMYEKITPITEQQESDVHQLINMLEKLPLSPSAMIEPIAFQAAYALKQQNFQKSMTYAKKALAINPSHIRSALTLTISLFEMGKCDEALQEARKALLLPVTKETEIGAREQLCNLFAQMVLFSNAMTKDGYKVASKDREDALIFAKQIRTKEVPNYADAAYILITDLVRKGLAKAALSKLTEYETLAPALKDIDMFSQLKPTLQERVREFESAKTTINHANHLLVTKLRTWVQEEHKKSLIDIRYRKKWEKWEDIILKITLPLPKTCEADVKAITSRQHLSEAMLVWRSGTELELCFQAKFCISYLTGNKNIEEEVLVNNIFADTTALLKELLIFKAQHSEADKLQAALTPPPLLSNEASPDPKAEAQIKETLVRQWEEKRKEDARLKILEADHLYDKKHWKAWKKAAEAENAEVVSISFPPPSEILPKKSSAPTPIAKALEEKGISVGKEEEITYKKSAPEETFPLRKARKPATAPKSEEVLHKQKQKERLKEIDRAFTILPTCKGAHQANTISGALIRFAVCALDYSSDNKEQREKKGQWFEKLPGEELSNQRHHIVHKCFYIPDTLWVALSQMLQKKPCLLAAHPAYMTLMKLEKPQETTSQLLTRLLAEVDKIEALHKKGIRSPDSLRTYVAETYQVIGSLVKISEGWDQGVSQEFKQRHPEYINLIKDFRNQSAHTTKTGEVREQVEMQDVLYDPKTGMLNAEVLYGLIKSNGTIKTWLEAARNDARKEESKPQSKLSANAKEFVPSSSYTASVASYRQQSGYGRVAPM